ncbi:hypothetical protein M9Y10_018183 [Tritrichomonas musculus]|uniref:Uncharacterized protein n=1 Tax=Tritrichomonas musculus TaxID=1915356 RepID=A0ABR2HNU0_9EUKA
MSSFATNFVNWFKEVPGKISNFYQGTKEKVKALRTHSKAEQPRFSSIHRSLYPVMSGDGLHAKRPLPDEEDLVRKTFAFNVLSEVFRDTYQTALGADGIAWEIGQSIDQLAKETQLWARCSRGTRYASREATDRYPGLVRLRNAFSAVLEELVKHLQRVDAIWDYHPVQDNPMQF